MADTGVVVVPDGDRVEQTERLARLLDPRAWLKPVTTEEEIQFAARRRVAIGQADRAITAGWVHAPTVEARVQQAYAEGEAAAESRLLALRYSPDGTPEDGDPVERVAEDIVRWATACGQEARR